MDPKTKVGGVCRLCQKATYLVESHIVSKFLLRRNGLIGKPKAKFDIICPADSNESDLHRQDGIKEYLLCGRCDNQKFGTWERYASQQFSRARPRFEGARMPGFVWQGLDYSPMKLFFLSILWRMGIAEHPFYGNVQLGRHEKHLRRMLLKKEPMESWRYGFQVGYLQFGDKTLDGVFSQPQMSSVRDGLSCVRFIMDGFVYFFHLTNIRPADCETANFLQPSGDWVIPFEQAKNIQFVWDEINLFRRHHGLWTDDDASRIPAPIFKEV